LLSGQVLRLRIVLGDIVEGELHAFDARLAVIGQGAVALILVELADDAVGGAQPLHGLAGGDFFLLSASYKSSRCLSQATPAASPQRGGF
jgi:hypothetical protein